VFHIQKQPVFLRIEVWNASSNVYVPIIHLWSDVNIRIQDLLIKYKMTSCKVNNALVLLIVFLLPLMHSFNTPEAAIFHAGYASWGLSFSSVSLNFFHSFRWRKFYFCRLVNCTQLTIHVHGVVMLHCVTMDAMTWMHIRHYQVCHPLCPLISFLWTCQA